MYKNKSNIELSMSSAEPYISAFFNNDQKLIDAFNQICAHMLDQEDGFIVRANSDIIGISKRGQYYRFYISKKDGEYFIKYKNRGESELFETHNVENYFFYNDACNMFFEKNKDSLAFRVRKNCNDVDMGNGEVYLPSNVLDEWLPIKSKAEKSLENAIVLPSDLERVYNEIIELLVSACFDREIMGKRDGEIITRRILRPSNITLQDLGYKYNVSRERIRQREKGAWRRLTTGIYRYKKSMFIPYRERLKNIMLSIPDESFANMIIQINYRNAMLGEWLQMIVTGKNEDST